MKTKYTDELNIQILISLLKAHNIKKIIASPGATNISFVASVQNDNFFEIYSCVDERSAAYLACGLSCESNEPVVLVCTGATASRNYISGLTEAYYRKLPIIAITASQHLGRVGQSFPQVIDRSVIQKDISKISVTLNPIFSDEDKWACNLNVNKALLECRRNGGGPVHINLVTTFSNVYDVEELPIQRVISRIENSDDLPKINFDKVAIFVGAHKKWSDKLESLVDEFCSKYNAVVLCDHTSNYNGKYKIMPNLICNQENYFSSLLNIDLLIDIGEISGAYMEFKPANVWRVNPDGEIRDTFKSLKYIFQMSEEEFFKKYNSEKNCDKNTYFDLWQNERKNIISKIDNNKIPFSNVWVASQLINYLEDDDVLHLGILNSLRSWNYFSTEKRILCYSNTGGFGIDGILSTIIGASYNNKNKKIYGIIGDLAFFYDMNSLGIRDIKNNIRLIIINNGCGTEFHNYNHRASFVGSDVGKFVAADGHYGNKSKNLVKNYVENLGFKYLSACNKKEFEKNIDEFISCKSDQSIIFEIFTDYKDESDAIYYMNNLNKDMKSVTKNKVKEILGEKKIKKIKNILKK